MMKIPNKFVLDNPKKDDHSSKKYVSEQTDGGLQWNSIGSVNIAQLLGVRTMKPIGHMITLNFQQKGITCMAMSLEDYQCHWSRR